MGALNPTNADESGLVHSAWMGDVGRMLAQQARPPATVLFRGEPGVGKDLAARVIHAASPRRDQSFMKVNCATKPQSRLESELFGHEKGATPFVDRRRLGRFEFANKGTLFLDEIDALPRALAPKILHVLRHGEVSRIGGRELIRVDVWIVASTQRIPEGTRGDEFWEDLLRLKVVEIRIPPLRERKEEIPALTSFFFSRFSQRYHRNAELSPETMALFSEYVWPGNIRELEETVRRLVVTGDARQIHQEIASRLQHTRVARAIA